MDQLALARRFRDLHHEPGVLLLANAWDVGSARLLESLPGCRALATTSAGIAASLGYPDGEQLSLDEMLDVVGRIARAVRVPVTADLEMGYGDTPAAVADTARAAMDVGAVGINLEDGVRRASALYPAEEQAAKVAAVREVADARGLPFVINARCDAIYRRVGDEAGRLEETIARARAYREAGADCVFVPGLVDESQIAELLRASPGPLNVLAGASTPPVARLAELGVARLSVGSGIARAALALVRRAGRELYEQGTYTEMTRDAVGFDELSSLLAAPAEERPAGGGGLA